MEQQTHLTPPAALDSYAPELCKVMPPKSPDTTALARGLPRPDWSGLLLTGLLISSGLHATDISLQDRVSVQICPPAAEEIEVPEEYQGIRETVDKFGRPYRPNFTDQYRRGFIYGWEDFLELFQEGSFDLDETTDLRRYPDGVTRFVSPLGPSAFRPGQLAGEAACRDALLALASERNLNFLPVRTPWAKKLMALGAGDPHQNEAGNPIYLSWSYTTESMRLTDDDLQLLYEVSLADVTRLHLPHTAITDAGFAKLPPMPQLTHLEISGKNLTGASFRTLDRFPRLTSLEMIGFRNVQAEDFASVGSLAKLELLDITAVEIGDEAITSILALPELTDLRLNWAYDGSYGAKLSPKAIAELSKCTRLKLLSLDGCAVDDTALRAIVAGLPELHSLTLKNTQITDDSLGSLQKLSKLEWLNLTGTQVTDAGIAALAAHPTLKHLFLTDTQVSDQALATLATLPKLKEICIREGHFSKAAITSFKELKPGTHVIEFRK